MKVAQFLDSFLLPKNYQKILAIGFEDEDIPRAYCPTVSHFSNIPNPSSIDDYLAQSSPDNQSYHQWKKLIQSVNYASDGDIIYLQPIGDFDNIASAPDMKSICEYVQAFYHPMQVVCLDPLNFHAKGKEYTLSNSNGKVSSQKLEMRRCHPWYEEKMPKTHRQFGIDEILKFLSKVKPKDAACLIAVTMEDLFEGAKDEFVVGMAGSHQVGLFSFCRYLPTFPKINKKLSKKEKTLFLLRCCKVAVHEIGHNFAIDHCSYYACCMNGSGNLIEDYSQPIHLCPVDLRKVIAHTKGDPMERYQLLINYYTKYEMTSEKEWVEKRVAWINETEDEIKPQAKPNVRQSPRIAASGTNDTNITEVKSKKRSNSAENPDAKKKKKNL